METEKKQVVTQVTNIAEQEEMTGTKVEIPSSENLREKAAASFVRNKKGFAYMFAQLSSKQKNRVALAVLELPTDQLPVMLKSDEEKQCFVYGQRMISDRFILTQFYISDEISKRRKTNEEQKGE